jgi:hypothetical protein
MINQKKQIIFLSCIIVILVGGILLSRFTIPVNEKGWVPDEATAIRIAEAVWLPIFGDGIYAFNPFKAEYNMLRNCWEVRGTLPENEIIFAELPKIIINRNNGKIIYVGIY